MDEKDVDNINLNDDNSLNDNFKRDMHNNNGNVNVDGPSEGGSTPTLKDPAQKDDVSVEKDGSTTFAEKDKMSGIFFWRRAHACKKTKSRVRTPPKKTTCQF